jgi:hypothetical protein
MNAAFKQMNIIGCGFQSTPNGYKIWTANMGTGGSSSGVMRPEIETGESPPCSEKIKTAWSYKSANGRAKA